MVERPYRYVRQDFFLARSFRNLDDLNAQFVGWLAEVANPRRHATTKRIVAEAFAEEKLLVLPAIAYSAAITPRVARIGERRISRDGMISVDGDLYSVPDSTWRRTVEVQIYPKEIRIFEAGQRIACHPVLPGKHQRCGVRGPPILIRAAPHAAASIRAIARRHRSSRLPPREAGFAGTPRSRSIPAPIVVSASAPWPSTTPWRSGSPRRR